LANVSMGLTRLFRCNIKWLPKATTALAKLPRVA
jgi:hypothetical protein